MRRTAITGPSRLSRRGLLAGLAALPTAAGAQALSGAYPGHLQGVCTDGRDGFYWSMTTDLVKTDAAGKVLKRVAVAHHHGDLCHADGRIYVAVNLGLFNDPAGRADSWIHVYDAEDLALLARHPLGQVIYGAGGIAFAEGRFLVVGGLPEGAGENLVYEYDAAFGAGRRVALASGHTYKGIQTAAFDGEHWWFGCYGRPEFSEVLLRADRRLERVERFAFDASTGLIALGGGDFLVARSACGLESCVARLAPARLGDWVESGRLRPG